MKVAVLGGKLQGLEILYLAQKAGFETILIDKNLETPAQNFCDNFLQHSFKAGQDGPKINGKLPDVILPACENIKALEAAQKWANRYGIPFALDLDAFRITSSKSHSNQIFADLRLPLPKPWPQCGFPLVVKPDDSSGSEGVQIIKSEDELRRHQLIEGTTQVIQEYLEGPSYSIEIIGQPGNYISLQVTELMMDKNYDCCQVLAGPLQQTIATKMEEMVLKIAEEINLHGIMDLEVILHGNELKILEIDARFPSQTPIAVYHSTGVNMVEILADLFVNKRVARTTSQPIKHCILEHLKFHQDEISVHGEHIMTSQGPLHHKKNFMGADEALTNYSQDSENCVGTFIFTGPNKFQLDTKQQRCHDRLRKNIKEIGVAA